MSNLSTHESNTPPDIIKIDPNNPATIEQYLDHVDLVHNDTAVLRSNVVKQLTSAVANIDFSSINTERLSDVQKKLLAVDTLNKLIEAQEKAIVTRASMRLKIKEVKDNEALGQFAADILSKIDLSNRKPIKSEGLKQDNLDDLDLLAKTQDIPDYELRQDSFDYSGNENNE